MFKILWKARKSIQEALKEAKEKRTIITLVRKRQSKFVRHVWRRGGLEHIITNGKIESKRKMVERKSLMDYRSGTRKKSTADILNSDRNIK
jgi:hypothetical protein